MQRHHHHFNPTFCRIVPFQRSNLYVPLRDPPPRCFSPPVPFSVVMQKPATGACPSGYALTEAECASLAGKTLGPHPRTDPTPTTYIEGP